MEKIPTDNHVLDEAFVNQLITKHTKDKKLEQSLPQLFEAYVNSKRAQKITHAAAAKELKILYVNAALAPLVEYLITCKTPQSTFVNAATLLEQLPSQFLKIKKNDENNALARILAIELKRSPKAWTENHLLIGLVVFKSDVFPAEYNDAWTKKQEIVAESNLPNLEQPLLVCFTQYNSLSQSAHTGFVPQGAPPQLVSIIPSHEEH